MTVKTYLASTVEAALALARHELGPDAMLMNTRPAPAAMQHLGRYEVVFAAAESSFRALLEENGVEPALIGEPLPTTRPGLIARMQSMIATSSRLGETVALIGPPGRGKTSTLLKLAVSHGLALRRPVRILSADNRRFGSFAATLGVEFQCFESIPELDRALDRPARSLTLIDTSRQDSLHELARCLVSRNADIHLVLRADVPAAGLLRMAARYRSFAAPHLIFTGLDEVETYGNLFSVAAQTGFPVSFLSAGQRIPDDLEPATAEHIVELALDRQRSLERAA